MAFCTHPDQGSNQQPFGPRRHSSQLSPKTRPPDVWTELFLLGGDSLLTWALEASLTTGSPSTGLAEVFCEGQTQARWAPQTTPSLGLSRGERCHRQRVSSWVPSKLPRSGHGAGPWCSLLTPALENMEGLGDEAEPGCPSELQQATGMGPFGPRGAAQGEQVQAAGSGGPRPHKRPRSAGGWSWEDETDPASLASQGPQHFPERKPGRSCNA